MDAFIRASAPSPVPLPRGGGEASQRKRPYSRSAEASATRCESILLHRSLFLLALVAAGLLCVVEPTRAADGPAAENASQPLLEPIAESTGEPWLPSIGELWLPHLGDGSHRHVGLGWPLEGTSWRNRPFHIGAMVGGVVADDFISGVVEPSDSVYGGAWIGYDLDHYWGTELRYGYASPNVWDVRAEPSPGRAHDWSLDVRAMYYPWGDSRWRPFLTIGAGMANVDFPDAEGLAYDETLFQIPFGGGVKYMAHRAVALRLELIDNLALGNERIDTMNNVTYTLGIEFHFGGPTPRRYYPYR